LQSPLRGPFQKKADCSDYASEDDTWVASPFIVIDAASPAHALRYNGRQAALLIETPWTPLVF